VRNISVAGLAKLAQLTGTEPLNQVEVQWTVDGPRHKYGDKLKGDLNGRIIELGNFDSITDTLGSSSDSKSVSVTLDDTDGVIKSIMDVADIHLRPVWVYQTFEGLDDSDKFLLFKGKVSSPVVWKEADRTVSFDIVSQLEDKEIGFSAEEGQFPSMPEDLPGEPWPLGFGTVAKCKALQLTKELVGTLSDGFGVPDPVILLQIRNLVTRGATATVTSGSATTDEEGNLDSISQSYTCQDVGDQVGQLQAAYFEQLAKVRASVTIIGGEKFPQGIIVAVLIDGKPFTGTFVGNVFTFEPYSYSTNLGMNVLVGPKRIVVGSDPPEEVQGTNTTNILIGSNQLAVNCTIDSGINMSLAVFSGAYTHPRHPDLTSAIALKIQNLGQSLVQVLNNNFTPVPPPTSDPDADGPDTVASNSIGYDESKLPRALGFFEASSGASVTLLSDEPIDYVVNILPSTVLSVCSEISQNNVTGLVGVPSSYYTVRAVNYGSFIATIITLNKPLTRYTNDKWTGNDLYVSYTSTVGPNICDIIQWMVETYSDLTIDSASFAHVSPLVNCYAANFCLHDRKQLLTVIKEIAWQSRCAVWLSNDVIYIKYLSEEPTSIGTVDSSNIASRSIEQTFTTTEDLVTKFVATWRANGYQQADSKIILRHNVGKYGLIEKTFDFYIYSDQQCVLKSATFWLIRYANTWKRARFKVFLDLLYVETLDCLTLDEQRLGPSVKSVVESAQYDSASNSIELECWLPVRAGEQTQYPYVWPAAISATTRFPPEGDPGAGGSGPGQNVSGTISIGASNETIVNDLGDPFPSDIGDVCCQPAIYTCESFTPYTLSTGTVVNYQNLLTVPPGGQTLQSSTTSPPPDDGGDGDCPPGVPVDINGGCCPPPYSIMPDGRCNNL